MADGAARAQAVTSGDHLELLRNLNRPCARSGQTDRETTFSEEGDTQVGLPHPHLILTILKKTQYSPNCSRLSNCAQPGRKLKLDGVVLNNYKGNLGGPGCPSSDDRVQVLQTVCSGPALAVSLQPLWHCSLWRPVKMADVIF